MANPEHVALIQRGVEVWNQWRLEHPRETPDFSGAELRFVDCRRANLRGANFEGAVLRGADLIYADLEESTLLEANLENAFLRDARLCRADFRKTDLRGVDFERADLSGADLRKADIRMADCRSVNFQSVDFRDADLEGADLRGADLSRANFYGANLTAAQVIGADFCKATLTGACVEEWNVGTTTKLSETICDYVYLQSKRFSEKGKSVFDRRRPYDGVFMPGEFSTLFQQLLDTVDLIFTDGIEWQSFFQSFQELRCQYGNQNLSIQTIERKSGDAFVIRLEVSADIDKKLVERKAKELYRAKLNLLKQHYSKVLVAKDKQVAAYRQQTENLMRMMELFYTGQSMPTTATYDFRGAQFAGGFAETVQGKQLGGVSFS
jgi:uncharacterized protein YjbI with pentapeptide repeats